MVTLTSEAPKNLDTFQNRQRIFQLPTLYMLGQYCSQRLQSALHKELVYGQFGQINIHHILRRKKCEGSSPNSLQPISYFGSIRELYVLDLKTKVFCRKKNQLHFPMDKGITTRIVLIVWLEIPQMPQISAQFDCPSPKILNF